jgi:hypothetical protein
LGRHGGGRPSRVAGAKESVPDQGGRRPRRRR